MKKKYLAPHVELVVVMGDVILNETSVDFGEGNGPIETTPPGTGGGDDPYGGIEEAKEHNYNLWDSWDD